MRVSSIILFLLLLLHLPYAQGIPQRPVFMERGIVQHRTQAASVTASDPRPLHQAITAIREEYGWVVDFEDPPYESQYDLVDDTAPQWRASHPDLKGVRRIAGKSFHSDYREKPNLATSELEEEQALTKIVSDYNSSGNPGKFVVRNEGNGRFGVIGQYIKDASGQDKQINPILDTPVTIPSNRRSAEETILEVLQNISAKTGAKVTLGGWASNILKQAQVTVGAANVPARNVVMQALESTKRQMVVDLLFDPDFDGYFLSIKPASLVSYDSTGRRATIPIDRLQHRIIYPQNAKSQ